MLPPHLTGPAAHAAERLVARGETIAVAESSAGGLIAASLLAVPGASRYFRGGAVIYSLASAATLLSGVPPVAEGVRSASEPWAAWLAASAAAKLGADWGVAETGAAGPRGNGYGDPAGHAWVAVAGPGRPVGTEHVLTGAADRAANMEAFAARTLTLLAAALDQ